MRVAVLHALVKVTISEKVREQEKEKDMEARSNVENGESSENHKVEYAGDVAEENEESRKQRISRHPLFGLLMETHLNCLKVAGFGELIEVGATANAANKAKRTQATVPSSSELDRFMEAYCIALSKLKEAMERSQKEAASFIDAMYMELKDLK